MMHPSLKMAGSFAFLLLTSVQAHAYGVRLGEYHHQTSVAGGIAHPSYNSSIEQNPAGMIYNDRTKIHFEAFQPSANSDLAAGAALFTGNAKIGAGLGGRYYLDSQQASIVYGLGFYLDAIRTSFGLGGETIFGGGAGSASTGINVGSIINTQGPFRFGLTAFDLGDGPVSYGAGLAFDPAPIATIAIDIGVNRDFDTFRIKPGLLIGNQDAGLTVGYGIDVGDRRGGIHVPDKLSVGGHLAIGRDLTLQASYNQLARLYAGLSFRF